MSWIKSMMGGYIESAVQIETAQDSYTLLLKSGILCTVSKVDGVFSVKSRSEVDNILDDVWKSASNFLGSGEHYMQIVHQSDPDQGEHNLKKMMSPAYSSASNIGFDVSMLLDRQLRYMQDIVVSDSTYIALFTNFNSLTKDQLKKLKIDNQDKVKDIPSSMNAQRLNFFSDIIKNRHDSFVGTFLRDMSNTGIQTTKLEVHDAIKIVREFIEPEMVSPLWKPSLPGDPIPMRDYKSDDIGQVLWPRVSDQVLSSSIEKIPMSDCLKRNNTYYVAMEMSEGPARPEMFIEFLKRAPSNLPYRLSFILGGNGLNATAFKASLAQLLTVFNKANKRIASAIKELNDILYAKDDVITGFRCSAVTWASSEEQANENGSVLLRSLEGWGGGKVHIDNADPVETFMNCIPGNGLDSASPQAAAPLNDPIHMLPLVRPSLPWVDGSLWLTSLDGRPMTFEVGSSLQESWNTLLFAPMGRGKSVAMAAILLSLIFKAGNKELPEIGIVDIGPTSAGTIALLKSLLPDDQAKYVQAHKMEFDERYSVNVCDTWLGFDVVLPEDRSYIVNLITMLATPSGMEEPYPNTKEVLGIAVDVVYKKFSRESAYAKMYSKNRDIVVDKALEAIHFNVTDDTTWWDCVDALFEVEDYYNAAMAQRYAVPIIPDIMAEVASNSSIQDSYGEYSVDGAPLTGAIANNLSASIREFRIFSSPTVFNMDQAKIVALDLVSVTKGDAKISSIMYMVARFLLTRKYYADEYSVLPFAPKKYIPYYRKIIPQIKSRVKAIFYDEWHMTTPNGIETAHSKAFKGQVLTDGRVTRKYKYYIIKASQLAADFSDAEIELATTKMILGVNSSDQAKEVKRRFGLSDSAQHALMNSVNRPGRMLLQYSHKGGEDVQLVQLPLCPEWRWGLTSVREDSTLRGLLVDAIGYNDAIRLLTARFPDASAVDSIRASAIRDSMGDGAGNDWDNDDFREEMTVKVANEMIREHRQSRMSGS